MPEDNVAVLIDYENTGLDSVQYLLDQLSDVGRVIIRRAYADWSVERSKRDQLLELGIEAKHLFRSTKSGKNSSDILLTIDAVELLYVHNVDAFVIVSSDSDFVPLVSKLRGAGKTVIGAGRRDVTSATLVKSCDRYIFLDEAAGPSRASGKVKARTPETGSLLLRALEASMDAQGEVIGSKLYQTMQRIDPSFNFRALGHRTFTHYLESSKDIRVERPNGPGDVIVHMDHPRNGDHDSGGSPQDHPRNGDHGLGGSPPPSWERDVDSAWAGRNRNGRLSGQAAASAAAKALQTSSLKAAGFRSLDQLLDASPFLRAKWQRDGNAILKQ